MFACILSFCPKFEAVINTIPTGIIGGISFVLYGMISAIGVRNVVENQVDFTNSRNLIIAAVILVCALGFNSVGGITFAVGGVTINLSGLAIAALAGILLNAILVPYLVIGHDVLRKAVLGIRNGEVLTKTS